MPYNFLEIKRKIKKLGFEEVRKGKGSHVIFSNGKITLPVSNHGGRDISPGVESKILKLVGLNRKSFDKL